jgi:hypothetical protein
MTEAEKKAAVRRFAVAACHRLAEDARRLSEQSGRGFWMSDLGAANPDIEYWWVSADAYNKDGVPPEVERDLTRQLATYDPRRQFVLLAIHADGTASSAVISWGPSRQG